MKTPYSPATVGPCIVVLLAVLVAVGCKSDSSPDRLKEEGYMERNPVGVPPEAKLVRHSAGHSGSPLSPDSWFAPDNITFRPTHAGRVWVVDEQNATIAFRGKMKAGDRLVVAPKANDILLNQATVYHRRLPSEHGFLIYFAKDADAPTTTTTTTAPSQ
jgi:hypothetical protein